MPSSLNIFPARVAIGRVTPSGDVLMTPEFSRALGDLMQRVGGVLSLDMNEIVSLFATESTGDAANGALARVVADIGIQQAAAPQVSARIAALERRIEDLARLVNSAGPAPVDWEHPGKIGAGSANSGKFTTLEATDVVKLNPANKQVEIKPTGAPGGGVSPLTIQPANVGQIDNMELGKTTPAPARVTTLNKITFTQPANGGTVTIGDAAVLQLTAGKTLRVFNTIDFNATDGAVLNIGGGGTLGSAAYQNSGAFAARTNTTLAAVATDPASTQALANSIRSVLISVGIGT